MTTRNLRPARRGFSLIEILVVIGILVGLMAILTPMVMKARKQAARTRQASDFNAIAMALEAYKADHGDYPRATAPGTGGGRISFGEVTGRIEPARGEPSWR